MIYLYVKTHLNTGLKYLGRTTQQDPYKYKGSGSQWTQHLKEFGNNVDTQILLATNDSKEFSETALFFSKLWDVTNSKDWANMCVEGRGVFEYRHTIEALEKISKANKGKIVSNVTKEKMSKSMKGLKRSEKSKISMKEKLSKYTHPMKGKIHTEETKTKMSKNNAKYWLGKKQSEETINKMRSATTGLKRSEQTKLKMSASQKGIPKSKELIEKMIHTLKNKESLVCPHCQKIGKHSAGMFKWHFDNCKLNIPPQKQVSW